MDHIFTGNNWQLISRRLRSRLVLFLVIAITLIGFTIYEVAIGEVSWILALVTLLIGGAFGFLYGRLVRVQWNEHESEVVTRMDTLGFILLAGYIILAYFRETLLADFFSGEVLTVIGLTLAGGILIGRFFGMHISLMRVLREHNSLLGPQ